MTLGAVLLPCLKTPSAGGACFFPSYTHTFIKVVAVVIIVVAVVVVATTNLVLM
jgi:hypothetical protein